MAKDSGHGKNKVGVRRGGWTRASATFMTIGKLYGVLPVQLTWYTVTTCRERVPVAGGR